MLYAFYVLFIFVFTFYIHVTHLYKLFRHFLDMFQKSLGVENEVFPKSFGDVWAIIWHHPRCLRRGLKISKTFFTKLSKMTAG